MRLESALYSGKEGLYAHGQAISVLGDNIANSNTTGFKAARPEFVDLLAEGGDGRSSTTTDGVGNGVAVSTVRQIFSDGLIEDTGRSLDVAIDGQGFFQVGDAADPLFSRSGIFAVNEEGLLVNSEGLTVLGFASGQTTLSTLNMVDVALSGAQTATVSLVGNLDASSVVTQAIASPQTFNEVNSAASFVVGDVQVYDSLGGSHPVSLAFFKTAANTWTAQAYIDGEEVGGTAGVPTQLGSNTTITFSSAGVIEEANKASTIITATPAYANGAAAGNFTLDLSSFTQFSTASTVKGVTQDGNTAGNVTNYDITGNGEIYAILDSGVSQLIGTIQLADFTNRDGLRKRGNASYEQTDKVGDVTVDAPGAGSLGEVQGGALERSTVDISSQFVDLVLYQRGYQANSQTLSATNQLLRDTLQLIR